MERAVVPVRGDVITPEDLLLEQTLGLSAASACGGRHVGHAAGGLSTAPPRRCIRALARGRVQGQRGEAAAARVVQIERDRPLYRMMQRLGS